MQPFLQILCGMANIGDTDQTVPSDLGLHCLHYIILVFEILGHLP